MASQSGSGRGRPTLTDVARAADVHVSLASRVLRDDPKGFASAATRARIRRAAEELGYRAGAGRTLHGVPTMALGLLLPDFLSPVYSSIAHGVEERAVARGYGLVLGTHAAGEPHVTITNMLVQGRVDAMLVASGLIEDAPLRGIIARGGGPVVLVNRQVRGIASSVVVRDGDAAALGVEHLHGLGHRSICGVFGPSTLDTMIRRRRGFLRRCAQLGVHAGIVTMPDRDYAAGRAGALRILDSAEPPTALLAGTFPMGVGVLAAVQDAGLTVPAEVSVLAMHDDQLADHLVPHLTTVALPVRRLGAEAVELALAVVAGGTPRRVVVPDPPQLMLRASTTSPTR